MRCNMFTMTLGAATFMLPGLPPPQAKAQDFLAQKYTVYVQHDAQGVFTKTIKEADTLEVHALITVLATALSAGTDGAIINGAVAEGAKFIVPDGQQDMKGLIRTPVDYTICWAKPYPMGAGDKGIETHNKTTFNTTLYRVVPGKSNDDGLGWTMAVPFKAHEDTRVAGSFEVVFVKAGQVYGFPCRPTGEHPWLAYNNETKLNVPCSGGEFCP